MESFIAGIMPAVIILGGMGLLFGAGLIAAGLMSMAFLGF